MGAVPFLYIENEKIYTREEYYKVFGGSASAYVKDDAKQKTKEEPKKQNTNSTVNSQKKTHNGGEIPMPSGGGGGGGGWGCFLFIVTFLALGMIFDEMGEILSSPTRLLSYCAIYIGLVLYGILLAKLFFGVASMIKGEGFMKGFNIKIIKELKEKFVWGTKKSKPKATVRTQSRSNTSEYSGPITYQHTCVKCGKEFSDQTAHNPYCEACRKKDEPPKPKTPVIYTHYCPRCGKAYPSTLKNPENKYCNACNQLMQQKKTAPQEPKQAMQTCKVCGKKFPANVNKSTGICMECTAKGKVKYPTVYTHHCPRCGKTYKSTLENPKSKYCDYCYQLIQKEKEEEGKNKIPKGSVYTHHCPVCGKTCTSVEKEPKDLRCESCKMAPEPNPQPTEEKKIFTCPKCGAKNRVPAGKGRIVITCGNRDCRNRFIVES